ETITARFAVRLVFDPRLGVRVTVSGFFIENGWSCGEYDPASSPGRARGASPTGIAPRVTSARWVGGPAACNSPPRALRFPYSRWSDSVCVYAVVRTC